MIQFSVRKPDGSGFIYFFGLSDRNMELLQKGKPIGKNLSALNDGSGDEIVLFYGKTEAEMVQMLRDAGLEIGEVQDARGTGEDGGPAGEGPGES